MLKKAILGILAFTVVAVALFCGVIAMQPDDFKVTRSATIAAPPEKVFEQVNDFHKWEAWSPWAKIDPAMKVSYSGADSGTGAAYTWAGNSDAGEGKMTIMASHPSQHIAIDLDFIKPFASKNVTEFTFRPSADSTEVTWSMASTNNFVMKAFCFVMDMDKLIGGDFEKGLVQLKTVAEAEAKQ